MRLTLLLAAVLFLAACGRSPTAVEYVCGPVKVAIPMKDHTTGRVWSDTIVDTRCVRMQPR